MRILSRSDVTTLLPMPDAIEAMAAALAALARGEGSQPLRQILRLPRGLIGLMPGLAGADALGLKAICVFPAEPGSHRDSHQGAVLLFDSETGAPEALVDAASITAIRTAAVSAVATDRLARKDATRLALLGSGVQARSHLESMRCVRRIAQVRVMSRTPENARRFAERESRRHGIPVEAVPDVRTAVSGADIVCTLTSATEPVLRGALLADGMHVNAVGGSVPPFLELDGEAVRRSRLFTDRRESLENEAAEYRMALRSGLIANDHLLAELGEVLLGLHPGRTSDQEITLFRSLGLAIEDLAAARLVTRRAAERGLGTTVDLGG